MSIRKIKGKLAKLVGEGPMEHWFDSMHLVRVRGSVVTLSVATDFLVGHIIKCYANELLASCKAAGLGISKVRLVSRAYGVRQKDKPRPKPKYLENVPALPKWTNKPIEEVIADEADLSLKEKCNRVTLSKPVKISTVLAAKVTGMFYGVSYDDLISTKRTKKVAWARHVAMYLSFSLGLKNLSRIGTKFNRDDTSVLYALRKVKERIDKNWLFRKEFNCLVDMFEL